MHASLLVARIRLTVRVPAALRLLITVVLPLHWTKVALPRPVNVATPRRVGANTAGVVVTVRASQVDAPIVVAMRSIPDSSMSAVLVLLLISRETDAGRGTDREALHVAHSAVPVRSIAVKLRDKPVVIPINRANTGDSFLLLPLVLVSDPACLNSKGQKRSDKVCQLHDRY